MTRFPDVKTLLRTTSRKIDIALVIFVVTLLVQELQHLIIFTFSKNVETKRFSQRCAKHRNVYVS